MNNQWPHILANCEPHVNSRRPTAFVFVQMPLQVIWSSAYFAALGTRILLVTGNIVPPCVFLVRRPVMPVHISRLGGAVVAVIRGLTAMGLFMLSQYVFCQLPLTLTRIRTAFIAASMGMSCRASLLLGVVSGRRTTFPVKVRVNTGYMRIKISQGVCREVFRVCLLLLLLLLLLRPVYPLWCVLDVVSQWHSCGIRYLMSWTGWGCGQTGVR
jgi:hypothetical protein